MERVRRTERFKSTYNTGETTAPEDPGMNFGETHLSFSRFEPHEFPPRAETETDQEYAEREMRADERVFMVGLLMAETEGPDGMAEALKAPDFRIRRAQRREFREAIGRMTEAEYSARINNVLGAFTSQASREVAMDIADYYWLSAKKQVGDEAAAAEIEAAENAVVRTQHNKPRRYNWKVEETIKTPERPITQAEVMLQNPQKYYRQQKQERRVKKFWGKVKEMFSGPKKEVSAPAPARAIPDEVPLEIHESDNHQGQGAVPAGKLFGRETGAFGRNRPENGYFQNTDFYQESEPGHYFGLEEDIL